MPDPTTPEMPDANRSDANPRPESTPQNPRPEQPTSGVKPGRDAGSPGDPRPEAPGSTSGADGGQTEGTTPTNGPDPRVAELQSLVVHLKADFDNYRKRSQKELASSARNGELEAVRRLLPAFANLERAIAAATAGGETSPLADGVRAIHAQIQGILAGMGVERIPAVGQPFDPSLHDAVAAQTTADVAPGTVTDEYEPGYRADGKALIPAKVRVATAE